MKERFFERVGVSGLLALLLIVAVIYLAVSEMPIPDELGGMAIMAVGWYFGDKWGEVAQGADERMKKVAELAQKVMGGQGK